MPKAAQYSAVVSGTSGQLAPGRQGRTCLIVSAPTTNAITLSLANAPAVVNVGIRIPVAQRPVILTRDMLGDTLDLPINAIADAGTETIGIIDAGF